VFDNLENQIIQTLINANINAQAWSGKADELFLRPNYTPFVRIIIESVDFQALSPYSFETKFQFSALLFFKALREEAEGAYPLITNIINALAKQTQYNVEPVKVDLLAHESGSFVYRLIFKANGRYVVPYPDDVTVTQISMEVIP